MSSRSLTYSVSSYSSMSSARIEAADRPNAEEGATTVGAPRRAGGWSSPEGGSPDRDRPPALTAGQLPPTSPSLGGTPAPTAVTPSGSPAAAVHTARAVQTTVEGGTIHRHGPDGHGYGGDVPVPAVTPREDKRDPLESDDDYDDLDLLDDDTSSSRISVDLDRPWGPSDHNHHHPGLPHTVTIPAPAAPYAQLCYHRAQDRMVTLMMVGTALAGGRSPATASGPAGGPSVWSGSGLPPRLPPPPSAPAAGPDALPEVGSHPGANEVVEVPSRGSAASSSLNWRSSSSDDDDSTATLLPCDPRPPDGRGPVRLAGSEEEGEEVVWVHDGWLEDDDDRLLLYGDYFYFYDSDDQLALLHNVHSSDDGDDEYGHRDSAALSSCGRLLLLSPAGLCQPSKRRSASFVRSSSSLPPLVGRATKSSPPRDRSALAGKLYEYAVLP